MHNLIKIKGINKFEKYIIDKKCPGQIRFKFDNNWGASLINYGYGSEDGLFELAVFDKKGLHYDNPVAQGDVRGYLTEMEVIELLQEIKNFKEETANV